MNKHRFIQLTKDTPRNEYGGKADGLIELVSLGFEVPDAIIIPYSVIKELFGSSYLYDSQTFNLNLMTLAEEINQHFDGEYLAVRSSSAREDQVAASFAGQFETVLGVKGIEKLSQAIMRCWESATSERQRKYSETMGQNDSAMLSLVVQRMVVAECSGIVFSGKPDVDRSLALVEASYGLGEVVVGGHTVPDRHWVAVGTDTVVHQTIGSKQFRFDQTVSGGIQKSVVESTSASGLALDEACVLKIANDAQYAANYLGRQVDLEWAIHKSRVYYLQLRPVTTQVVSDEARTPYVGNVDPYTEARTLWSRMDIGEIFTGQLSPIGVDFAKYYQMNVHEKCGRWTGARDYGDMSLHMGYLQNHVYLNVSYTAHLLSQMPHMRDLARFTNRFTSPDVDPTRITNPFGIYSGYGKISRSFLFFLGSLFREIVDSSRRAKRMDESRRKAFALMRSLKLEKYSNSALEKLFEKGLDYFSRMNAQYMPYYINASTIHALLEGVVSVWVPEIGPSVIENLKTDMSNLRTVAASEDIDALFEHAKEYSGVYEALLQAPLGEAMDAISSAKGGKDFISEALEPFLMEHGVRGHEEMELANPRWVDEPEQVVEFLVRRALEANNHSDQIQRPRILRETVGIDELPISGVRRAIILTVAKLYKKTSEQREVARMAMITSSWIIRKIIIELSQRLCKKNILEDPKQIWCCKFEEIRSALRGDVTRIPSGQELANRDADWKTALEGPLPPQSFYGYWNPTMISNDLNRDEKRITGLPVSTGVIKGRVCVIKNLDRELRNFRTGEILVAPYTDASWTPLIRDAAAIVTDEGSYLSHSAIVAREFGIP